MNLIIIKIITLNIIKIRKIKKETGNNPIILKIFENISRDEAIKLEIKYIKKIGRFNLKSGPLANLTDGGEGCSHLVISPETKKLCSVAQLKIYNDPILGPERKTQTSVTQLKIYNDPILGPKRKKHISETQINWWYDQEYGDYRRKEQGKKSIVNSRGYWHDSKNGEYRRIKAKIGTIDQWKDENYRKIMIDQASKIWKITNPNGNIQIIKNLAEFCKLNKLPYRTMGKIAYGKKVRWKEKWKCEKMEEPIANC